MKYYFFIFLCLLEIVYGQSSYKPISDCSGYNSFLYDENKLDAFIEITDTIFPNGLMVFKHNTTFSSVEENLGMFNLNSYYTFQFKGNEASLFEPGYFYEYYQEYYKGIKVESGGYSIKVGGSDDPCAEALILNPSLISNIETNVIPTINSNDLDIIVARFIDPNLGEDITLRDPELIISYNIINNCQSILVWKVIEDNHNLTLWIDATSGMILKSASNYNNCLNNNYVNRFSKDSEKDKIIYTNESLYPIVLIPAITLIYGQVQLDNLFENGRFFLKSPDEKLNVYKMNSTTACIQTKYDDFKPEFIPFTINNSWPETNLSKSASQAFFVLQTIVPYYNELGIEFEKIHCGIACNSNGLSNAYGTSKGNEAYILVSDDFGSGLGENKTAKYSIFDVIGHELCHAYLDRFFKSNEGYGKALMHEGISDVFGNFVEILYQGFEDWINEDDIGEIGRQANLPVCYTDVKDSHDPHITGTVIGHWYFLATRNTNVLTHNEVMEILIEALKIGKSNLHDIKDLLYATLVATGKKYGINSSEYKLIADSWNAVCLGPIPTSNFTVEGPITMCEEDDQLTLCISGGFPYSSYKWTVIGTKGTEWVLQGSYPQIGNSVITSGATCLQVLDLPKYSYYPKPITIRVCQQISVPGASRCADHKLKLIDCDGQDPNCNQTSSQIQIFGNENSNSSEINISDYSIPLHNDREPILKVYDIYGRLLSTSKFEPDNLDNLRDYNSVLIIEIIDSKGTSHFTKKLFTKN